MSRRAFCTHPCQWVARQVFPPLRLPATWWALSFWLHKTRSNTRAATQHWQMTQWRHGVWQSSVWPSGKPCPSLSTTGIHTCSRRAPDPIRAWSPCTPVWTTLRWTWLWAADPLGVCQVGWTCAVHGLNSTGSPPQGPAYTPDHVSPTTKRPSWTSRWQTRLRLDSVSYPRRWPWTCVLFLRRAALHALTRPWTRNW